MSEFEDPEHGKYEMYVDLGAYGIPQKVLDKKPFDIVQESRAVEDFVHRFRIVISQYATFCCELLRERPTP